MVILSKGIFIIGAKRTPFCKYGGALREMPASHVFAATAKDAIQSANIDPGSIDHTFVGNVHYLSQCDGGKTPRYCGIYSGVPLERPALGVNKACASGLQAVINGALEIETGLAKLSLTGGTELMSALPHLVRNVRFGTALGTSYQFEDHIKQQFLDSQSGLTLQKSAEELAKKYQVTREDADKYALESYEKWKSAQASNVFASELTNITATIKKKEVTITKDDIPDNTSPQSLAASPAVLDDGVVVTAGNSANPGDGAAALLLADEETVKSHQLKPLARLTGWVCAGVGPADVGLGAVVAINKLLGLTGTTTHEVDLFEINDVFASQAIVTSKLLGLNPSKLNVDGGAVTIGHPVAATGARMAVHLVHEMKRRNLKNGIVASTCGGDQGVAILLQAM